jgi:hypothetical protein
MITTAAKEWRKRSPLAYFESARGVPIAINHGIHDGHGDNSVPISQSLRAFNQLAASKVALRKRRSTTLLASENPAAPAKPSA